jgi:protein-disulfide isomerase
MSKKERETNRAARAAAIQQAQARRERNRRLLISGIIVAVLAAVVATGVLLTSGNSSDSGGGADVPAAAEGQALVLGEETDAPKVVVWEDFLCPYCREFEEASRDLLHEKAASGDVQVEYRPFQLLQDDYSQRSLSAWAAVLEGGTPAQALDFHDLLFENQPYEAADDKPDTDELVDLAREAGVEDDAVLEAAAQEQTEFVEAANQAARDAGITGTPTVTVDGEKLEGDSIADMVDNLEAMLEK